MAVCSVCGKGIGWGQGVSCVQCGKKVHGSCTPVLKNSGAHVDFCSYDCAVALASEAGFSWETDVGLYHLKAKNVLYKFPNGVEILPRFPDSQIPDGEIMLPLIYGRFPGGKLPKGVEILDSASKPFQFYYLEFVFFISEALSKCSDGCFKSAVPILVARKSKTILLACMGMSPHKRNAVLAEAYFGGKFDKDVFASLNYSFANFSQFLEAKEAETAGRYEDAAKIFEGIGMSGDAGRTRGRGRRVVTVDLNDLIRQLKEGTVYRCPTCGGKIKISSSTQASQLSKCEYCGNVLRTDDLTKFINDILKNI